MTLILGAGHFTLAARLLDNADENILHGESAFPRLDYADACRFQLLPGGSLAGGCVFRCNDVEAVAKERHSPGLHVFLKQIRRPLRLVDDELQQMTGLSALDTAWGSLRNQLAG